MNITISNSDCKTFTVLCRNVFRYADLNKNYNYLCLDFEEAASVFLWKGDKNLGGKNGCYRVRKNAISLYLFNKRTSKEEDITSCIAQPIVWLTLLDIREKVILESSQENFPLLQIQVLLELLLRHTAQKTTDKCPTKFHITPYQMNLLKAYVMQNLEYDLKSSDLASYLSYSAFHFTRIFKKETGLSPTEWLQQIRMERAMVMLFQQKCSVRRAASTVGYKNQSYFSKIFKERFGCNPTVVLNAF